MSEATAGTGIDTTVPHSARIWNYWLGGKDNFEVDRRAGDAWIAIDPGIVPGARASRDFLKRTITFLAAEAGVRQFLDVGTGLPTLDNTHEVAQRIAPESRVVYVDNDPLVLAHARALLVGSPEGVTTYVDADMRDTERVLASARESLDLSQPVGLVFMGVLGHVADFAEVRSIVANLLDPLPSGSYLAVNDATSVLDDSRAQAGAEYADSGAVPYHNRHPDEIRSLFDGLELVEPGFVTLSQWRPADGADTAPIDAFGGVGRKP